MIKINTKKTIKANWKSFFINDNLRITTPNSHNLVNGDLVVLSGLTSSLSHVNGSYIIGVSSIVSSTISPII